MVGCFLDSIFYPKQPEWIKWKKEFKFVFSWLTFPIFPLFFLPQQSRCSKSSNQPRFLHFESLTLDSDELCEKWTCQVLPFWTTRNFLHLGESKRMVRHCLCEKWETGYVGSKIKKICWTQENSEKWIISWISSKVFEAQHQLGNTS